MTKQTEVLSDAPLCLCKTVWVHLCPEHVPSTANPYARVRTLTAALLQEISAHDAAMGELRKDSADTLAALNVAIAEGSKCKAERDALSSELEKARTERDEFRRLLAIARTAGLKLRAARILRHASARAEYDWLIDALPAIDSALSTHPGNGREGG